MTFWLVASLVFGAALVAGVLAPRGRPAIAEPVTDPNDDLPGEPADAERLARLGTPDTVAELVADGRGDELRGLGYEGEL